MNLRVIEPTVFDIGWLSERMRPDEIEQWCALTGHATADDHHAALHADFRWQVPAHFNIAEQCCARWGRNARSS